MTGLMGPAAIRGLQFTCLMLLFGSATLFARLSTRVPELAIESAGLRRTRLVCIALALLTTPVHLALVTAQMAPAGMVEPSLWLLTLTGTQFGQWLVCRTAILLGLVLALVYRREALTALLSGAALATLAVTSHAAAASPSGFALFGIVSDALHLLCGGLWLGGLAALASILVQRPEAPRLHRALSLFADWAMIAVLLLALTGLLNTANIVLGGEGHAEKSYLGVLGAKLVLVLAMVGLALANHFRLMPRLARAGALATLKGNIVWELGLGLVVVLLAGLLGLLPPTS